MTRPMKNVTAINPKKVTAATDTRRMTAHAKAIAPLRFFLGAA